MNQQAGIRLYLCYPVNFIQPCDIQEVTYHFLT